MILTPLMYYAKSDRGKQGYVMPLEIALIIGNRKPPPDEREGTVRTVSDHSPTARGRKNKTPYMGD